MSIALSLQKEEGVDLPGWYLHSGLLSNDRKLLRRNPSRALCTFVAMLRWKIHRAVCSRSTPPPPVWPELHHAPTPPPPTTSWADPPNGQRACIRWCGGIGGMRWRRWRRRRNTEPKRCHIHQCDCYEPACHWVHSSLCDVNRGMTHRLQWNEKERRVCPRGRARTHARTSWSCVCVCAVCGVFTITDYLCSLQCLMCICIL